MANPPGDTDNLSQASGSNIDPKNSAAYKSAKTKLSSAKRNHTKTANKILDSSSDDATDLEYMDDLYKRLGRYRENLDTAFDNVSEIVDISDSELENNLDLDEKAIEEYFDFRKRNKPSEPKKDTSAPPPRPKVVLPEMKPFSGKIRDYPNFKSTFREKYEPYYADLASVILKDKLLKGHQADLCKSLKSVDEIFSTLDKTFGDSGKLAESVLNDIQNLKVCAKNNVKDLENLVQKIRAADTDLESVCLQHHIRQYHTVSIITDKLPMDIRKRWASQIARKNISTDDRYSKILEFLDLEIRTLELSGLFKEEDSNEDKKEDKKLPPNPPMKQSRYGKWGKDSKEDSKPPDPRSSGGARGGSGTFITRTCPVHKMTGHSLSQCQVFKVKSADEHVKFFKENSKICRSCLEEHDGACTRDIWPCRMENCGKRHFHFLHDACLKLSPQDPKPHSYGIVRTSIGNQGNSLSPGQRIRVANSIGQIGIVNALWDSGSNVTLILNSTCEHFGLIPVSDDVTKLRIEIVGGSVNEVDCKLYNVPLYNLRNEVETSMQAYSVNLIGNEIDRVNFNEAFSIFGIPPSEQGDMLYPEGKIQLLIGSDNAHLVLHHVSEVNGLRLSESALGRIIWGRHPSFINTPPHSRAIVVRHEKSKGKNNRILSVSEDMVPSLFATEIMGVQCTPNCGRCSCGKCSVDGDRMTSQERFEYQQIMDSIKLENGIITASFPLKKDLSSLPDNYDLAVKRLIQTEHQLKNDPNSARIYKEQFQDMINRQVLRKLPDNEIKEWNGAVQYLPHHMIYKPSSTSTPARIVFDPSSPYKGKAVNDYWGNGPCLLNDQLGILYRFRENVSAIAGDISKMYNTIHTRPQEWHLHRVLWRDLDTRKKPETYAIVRNSFGSGPAGTVAIAAKDFLANLKKEEYPRAADTIKNQTFVDDILDSTKNEEESIKLTEDIDFVLSQGNFKIKKWLIVNSPTQKTKVPAKKASSQRPSSQLNSLSSDQPQLSATGNPGSDDSPSGNPQPPGNSQADGNPKPSGNSQPDGKPQAMGNPQPSDSAVGNTAPQPSDPNLTTSSQVQVQSTTTTEVHIGGNEDSVLGIAWNTETDEFFFKTHLNFSKRKKKIRQGPDLEPGQVFDKSIVPILTRRLVMSQVYGLYDVLGLLAPFVVELKFALGKLWRIQEQVDWDVPVPDDHDAHWRKLFEIFFELRPLRFPRCLSPDNPEGEPILVMFSDSSLIAFAAAAYIWFKCEDGSFFSRLISAKSRMWPIKPDDWISIERGELQAAVLSKRLSCSIQKEMRVKFQEVVYVIDSEIAFSQINTDSHLFNIFVGHRVAEIRSATETTQWWIAKSEDNASADLASRGTVEVSKLDRDSVWQVGPPWLRQPRDTWPLRQTVQKKVLPELRVEDLSRRVLAIQAKSQTRIEDQVQPKNPELARTYAAIQNLGDAVHGDPGEDAVRKFTEKEEDFLASRLDLTRHDNLDFWLIITYRILTAFSSPDAELLRKLCTPSVVLPEQRQIALNFWLRQAQRPLHAEVKSSKYKTLTPFTDEEGIIRVNGRFLREPGSYQPILLPHYHPLSKLIVISVHRRGHAGAVATSARVRANYHILQLRQLCYQIRNACMLCRVKEHRLLKVPMASLPPERIKPSYPFEHAACDIAGPFHVLVPVKTTRNRQSDPMFNKAYVLLLNCLSTRAIHLEVMHGMDTDAFLLAFRRFVCIRGQPKSMWSDNGGQIVSADRELQDLVNTWDDEKILKYGAQNGTKWEYCSPGSPWQNGSSEALVKSVKSTFYKITTQNQKIPIMELQTIFYEIAEILNERPIGLSNQGASGNDFHSESNTYICPNQLLLGRCSVTIPAGPFESVPLSSKNRLLANQTIVANWWNDWSTHCLPRLISQKKWFKSSRESKIGDIVHVKDINPIRGNWSIGEIVELKENADKIPRNVLIRYKLPGNSISYKPSQSRHHWRDVKNLVLILPVEERPEMSDS